METHKEESKNTEVILSIPNTTKLGELKGLKHKYKATAGYRTQEEWQRLEDIPIRCFYMGMKEIPNEDGESVNCAVFAGEDGIFLAAQMVLVDSVRRFPPNTPFEITYLGKKSNKSSKGSTNLFDVILLENGEEIHE